MAVKHKLRSDARTRTRPRSRKPHDGDAGELKRSRMLAAAVEVVGDVGYARMTVARIISRARVSRKTFYDVFSDRDDCFLAAFEQSIERAHELAADAYEREPGWHQGIRAALAQLLLFMDQEPAVAKLCVVEALAAGERVRERRTQVLEQLVAVIDRGRSLASEASQPPQVTAEGIVGAVFAVLHTRLLDGAKQPLTSLLRPLMSMIVLPYLGARAARRELLRPPLEIAPTIPSRPASRRRDPLAGLDIRLTYRTVRVLMVIGEHPGASNREIADGSGIADQGQISKLLTRLARLKLVRNSGGGQELGSRNAWHLTERGAEVERATRLR